MKKSRILIVCLLLVACLGYCAQDENTDTPAESKVQILNEVESTVETTAVTQAIETDWEIVTREGHPRFNDSEELARIVWGDVSEKKILFADSFARYKETNIITMDSMNGKLDSIEVYFQNFTTPITLTVEEALPVISSYLPLEEMKDCYEIMQSFIAIPMEGKEGKTHYFISYVVKDEVREDNPDLFYDVVIEIQVDDECVQMFRVFNRFPNWALKLEFNGYTEQVWDYDFLAE